MTSIVRTTKVSEKAVSAVIEDLRNLSYNLWWSWNPAARQIFRDLSPYVWETSNHNPVEVLHWVSEHELRVRLQNQDFYAQVRKACGDLEAYMSEKRTWMAKNGRALKKKWGGAHCVLQRRVRTA